MTSPLTKRININCLPTPLEKPEKKIPIVKSEPNHKAIKQFQDAVHKLIALGIGKGSEKAHQNNIPCITLSIDYWPEITHPEHYCVRLGYPIFKIWKNHFQKNENFQSFLLSQKASAAERICLNTIAAKDDLESPEKATFKIKILSDAEKQNHEVFFWDCFLMNKNKIPISGAFLLVIDLDQKIYATPIDDYSLNHVSFSGGKPVSFAGEIHTNELGIIQLINSRSQRFPASDSIFIKALKSLESRNFNSQYGTLHKHKNNQDLKKSEYIFSWKRF